MHWYWNESISAIGNFDRRNGKWNWRMLKNGGLFGEIMDFLEELGHIFRNLL